MLYFYCTLLLIPLIAFTYLFSQRKDSVRQWCFGAAIFIAFAFRLAMPLASPEPIIDVFVIIQESAEHLLEGKNPYDTPISDVYGGRGQVYRGYPYPPASLYPLTTAYGLFGDARYAYILSEAIVAVVLWSLAGPTWARRGAELLVLLFLFQPQSLFVLEQSWTEPLVLACLSIALLLKERGYPLLATVVYGYFLSLKQYLVFFALHWLLMERRWQHIAIGALAGTATFLPFLLWDPLSLWQRGVWASLVYGIPHESLNISTLLHHTTSLRWGKLPGALAGTAAGMGSLLLFWKQGGLYHYLMATSVTMFTMLLWGNQAFTNYYYLLGGLLLHLLAKGKEEGESTLFV